MDNNTRLWVAATKAWIKTQKLAIETCDLSINQAFQQISLFERVVRAEQQERMLKINQLKEVKKQLSKATKL